MPNYTQPEITITNDPTPYQTALETGIHPLTVLGHWHRAFENGGAHPTLPLLAIQVDKKYFTRASVDELKAELGR